MDKTKLSMAFGFFQALLNNTTRDYFVSQGYIKSKDSISFSEVIAIAKVICQIASVICPLVQDM